MFRSLLKTLFSSVFLFITNLMAAESILPIPLSFYANEKAEASIWQILLERIQLVPFNAIATLIFLLAIVHTFCAGFFRKKAHHFEQSYHKAGHEGTSFSATVFHFLGEIEVIFGLWVIPLLIAMACVYGFDSIPLYLNDKVSFTEPLFVMVVMFIASTRPVLFFAEKLLERLVRLIGNTATSWWYAALVITPLLGSLITEPAAMTIAALILADQFYRYKPSARLAYGTLGLLFVNVSVGGVLTHFAAPPVVMVAKKWELTLQYMFSHFGLQAVCGIILSTALYGLFFRKDLSALSQKALEQKLDLANRSIHIPFWVTVVHLGFLAWSVVNLHHPVLFIGGFLFFLGFVHASSNHQSEVKLRSSVLVGFFLAGLVIHGTLQSWWIEPILSRMNEFGLFSAAVILTSFNDNAAITFLASLVPQLSLSPALQHAVLAGAVTGGGLTVIANAPNPAGQSLLNVFFKDGISPLRLLLGALAPTLIMSMMFCLWP
jgi:hypothetical protein